MEAFPSVDTVMQALDALYRQPDAEGKRKASLWLTNLQSSNFAWPVADQLLRLHKDVESCCFAAQTMRAKVQQSFQNVCQESQESLRASLLSHCANITRDSPNLIVTPLCLAVADLAVQMASWTNAVEDLIGRFGNNANHWSMLLDILALLPEEISSTSLVVGKNRRNDATSELITASPALIQFLTTVMDASGGDVQMLCRVMKCLSSWLDAYFIPLQFLTTSVLLVAPFSTLRNVNCDNQLHTFAADCVCSAFTLLEDLTEHVEFSKALMEGVTSLVDCHQQSLTFTDSTKTANFARVFSTIADLCIDHMISSPNEEFGSARTLELLLVCMTDQRFAVADEMLEFWSNLVGAVAGSEIKEVEDRFRPYIDRLVVCLCMLCKFDANERSVPADGELVSFRERVSDLLGDIKDVTGPEIIMKQMLGVLQSRSQADGHWPTLEAAMFVMTSVARHVDVHESVVTPQIVDTMLSVPATAHVALQQTCLILVGQLGCWLNKHRPLPYLERAVSLVVGRGLTSTKTSTAAATALLDLCHACTGRLADQFDSLTSQCLVALKLPHRDAQVALNVLKGLCHVLAKLPHSNVTTGFDSLCFLQVAQIDQMMKRQQPVVIGNELSDPVVWMDRLSAIYDATSNTAFYKVDTHPCRAAVERAWPVLLQSLDYYSAHSRIMDRLFRCFRCAIRCLGTHCFDLFDPVLTKVVQLYQTHPHPCCLYLASVFVDQFGYKPECQPKLRLMFEYLCQPTFALLSSVEDLNKHPDTVDDFFRLCLQMLENDAESFLQLSAVDNLVQQASVASTLLHNDAQASALRFLVALIDVADMETYEEDAAEEQRSIQLAQSLLLKHGRQLMHNIVHASVFQLPSHMLSRVAEFIPSLVGVMKEVGAQWLDETLRTLPTQRADGVVTVTEQQMTRIQHVCSGRTSHNNDVSSALKEFVKLFR